jgi:hypothetical protein
VTYAENNTLINDTEFRGRVKVACLQYATSISIEPSNTVAHNTRLRWAQTCFQQPDMTAQQITPPTTMDPAIQSAGSDVTDAALQAAVEATVNKMM